MAGNYIASANLRLVPKIDGLSSTIKSQLGSVDASGHGAKMGRGLLSGIGGGMAGLSDTITSKFSVATVAVGNLVSSAVQSAAGAFGEALSGAFDSYASYEQLLGGVEKIFDQADQVKILEDARGAYADLNMSANEYLESINQVGATFAQTMGDQKGYDTARTGMKAIADYASGTGRNLNELNDKFSLITRATSSYQSIADQFSGILPATSADFLEQAQAAGFLSDQYTKLTEVPVAEYQEAVSKMLEKGVEDMGLLGNTAMESEKTISGSIAMAKSSWENFLVALGDNSGTMDLDAATKNLVDSLGAVADNALPLALRLGSSIASALPGAIATAMSELPTHIQQAFDDAGINIDLSELFGGFDQIAEKLTPLIEPLQKVGEEGGKALDAMMAPISEFLSGNGPEFESMLDDIGSASERAGNILEHMSTVMEPIGAVVGPLVVTVLSSIVTILSNLVVGALAFADAIATAFATVSEHLSVLGLAFEEVGGNIMTAWDGVVQWFSELPAKVGAFFEGVALLGQRHFQALQDFVSQIPTKIVEFFSGLGERITNAIGSIHFPQPSVSWESIDVMGLSVNIPHVSWNAKGAIFDKPTVLQGVGEAGPEAVVPLSGSAMRPFAREIASEMGTVGTDELVDEIRALREDVRNVKLWMDSTVVGGLVAPSVNRALGRMEASYAR